MSGCASPKILQRRIHNKLLSLPSTSQLSLLQTNLLPTHHYLSAIVTQFQLHSMLITSLDCHFCILDEASISTLCQCLVNLKELKMVDCGLKELDHATPWPICLRCIDFSRNQLTECPQGLSSLVYLTTLNLSGNKIKLLDPSLLRLPLLEKFHLVQNPVQNIPKSICRQGVDKMREYFKVETLPLPPQSSSSDFSASAPNSRKSSNSMCDLERCQDLRLFLLRQQGSFDSGYESVERCRTTSCSSIDTCDLDSITDHTQRLSPKRFPLPSGYSSAIKTDLCQVYLPEGCADQVCIELVKDLSLYPKVESNELLITPVVQISPHGRKFCPHQPAIVVLPHCAKPEYDGDDDGHAPKLKQRLVPVYSDSVLNQPAAWCRSDCEHSCKIFQDHVMFTTTHFSLFAVLSILPYPSASISVGPNYGGILTVAELPGFEITLPPTLNGREVTVTATVYYDDASYNIESDERTLASPCVGLEPHGAQFDTPVQITLPIPRYTEVLTHFPDAKLELWHATPTLSDGVEAPVQPLPEDWEPFQSSRMSLQERAGYYVIVFTTNHFSWWETLWDIGRRALQKVGLAASIDSSRARYVSVRIQALMSPPVSVGAVDVAEIQTFGLLVAVYKFGSPLSPQSNYPWSLLDTGSNRIYLQIGQLEVSVQGNFLAMEYEDPTNPLCRSTELIDFNGDDFCQRFEFALQLKRGCEVCRGMVIGKLHFKQWNGSTPSHQNYNLVVGVGSNLMFDVNMFTISPL